MIVIADDITGAAEIAGIASSQGKPVRLLCGCPVSGDRVAANTTVVIATDTRSMTEAEAVPKLGAWFSPPLSCVLMVASAQRLSGRGMGEGSSRKLTLPSAGTLSQSWPPSCRQRATVVPSICPPTRPKEGIYAQAYII